ncbi:hyaluronan metabolic process [Homalodisca vitripennis]|nr:hyaluronan metabolic process [Homalodisca vitripennis]
MLCLQAWSPTAMYSSATEHLSRWDIEAKPEIIRNTTLDKRFVIEATPENIASARAYLGNYSDLGATNIMGGLRTGLELVSIGSDLWSNESDPPQPVVVFLTDGEPNVEEYNTDAIINKTKPLNTKDCPIFSLAFGYGADFNFLRKLSLSNYGFARNIYEAADATDQLKNFYKTISSPLLSNVTFTYLPGQRPGRGHTDSWAPVGRGCLLHSYLVKVIVWLAITATATVITPNYILNATNHFTRLWYITTLT